MSGEAFSVDIDVRRDLAAFDRLPARLRAGVSSAPFSIDALVLLSALHHGQSEAELLQELDEVGADWVAEGYRERGL